MDVKTAFFSCLLLVRWPFYKFRDPFVESPISFFHNARCAWPFYPPSFKANKGWRQSPLLWLIPHKCGWAWSKPLNKSCCESSAAQWAITSKKKSLCSSWCLSDFGHFFTAQTLLCLFLLERKKYLQSIKCSSITQRFRVKAVTILIVLDSIMVVWWDTYSQKLQLNSK